jgi:putative heme-binding domain-containing protein
VLLRLLDGKGEHGPHAVVPAPDGGNLLVLCGNHTRLPELARSRLPRNWQDDVLLPRIDDPEGHAVGIEAPGGFVCLVDPDGMEWELYCAGLRNAYDLAVAPDGAVFTFDADMEWDMGLPWYRPTRILEVVSGGDYGWRAGSAKWPADFPDTLPAVVDIGPGSPTGMLWTRHGVLALDWTFGIVYRVRPAPSGAGFRGASARFLAGQPLPLVDAVADGDGCLLLTGGRGVVSNLYRVLPAQPGHPSAAGAWPGNEAGRQERRRLEAFHGRADPTAADAAWPHLGSTDPFLRHAARIAVESQPVDAWRRRALAAPTDPPWSALTALLALARQGVPEDLAGIVAALGRMRFSSLDRSQRIAWLRIHQLALRRMGGSGAALQAAAVGQLQPHFPSGDPRLDAELCALLCWLDAPGVLDRAVPLLQVLRPAAPPPWKDLTLRSAEYGPDIGRMLQAMPPTDQIAIANALRTVRHGWTLEQRAVLFRFLGEARRKKGGASHDGYLGAMLDHAWDGCSEAERAELAGVAGMAMAPLPAFRGTPPHGPGRNWRLDEAAALARHGLKERNFASGRNLFHAAGCASCHRFAGEGGSVGQDLTSLGNRFTSRDVLEAILEPNKVISDQYGGSVLRRKDGSTLSGRAVRSGAGADEAWVVWPTVADPKPVRVPAADVVSVEPSPLSPMPAGLVDRLGPDELLDLLAFLLSRGDGAGPMFAR